MTQPLATMPTSLTGLSAQAEWEAQERLRAIHERRMERRLAQEIRRAMAEMATSDPVRLAMAQDTHARNLERILATAYGDLFQASGDRIMQAKAHPIDAKFENRFMAAARDWIRSQGARRVRPIAGTTLRQAQQIVRQATLEGWDAGEGQDQLGRRIVAAVTASAGQISAFRSRVIARTETHTAAQAAQQEAAAELGLPLLKQWVAAEDERTREAHAEANGQTVEFHLPFVVDGEELMYPGDQSGSAENVINCRCVSIAIVAD